MHVTDAPWHNDGTGTYAYSCSDLMLSDAVRALLGINARHLGVFVGSDGGEGHASMEYVSTSTGSVAVPATATSDHQASSPVTTMAAPNSNG